MTMRDEILAIFARYNCTNLGGIPDDILAKFQKRLDEIKFLCRTSGSRLNSFKDGYYCEIDKAKEEIHKIYNLCNLDEPEPMTKTEALKFVALNTPFTKDDGESCRVNDGWDRLREYIRSTDLVKDGDTND